jgi:hypothetical protein
MPQKNVPASSVPTTQPAAEQPLPIDLADRLGGLTYNTCPKLVVLMRWAEAEAEMHRGYGNPALEQLAWRGVEMLCEDVLRDLESLQKLAEVKTTGFIMHADAEKGGAA